MAPFRFTLGADNTSNLPSYIAIVQNGVQLKFSTANPLNPYNVIQLINSYSINGWCATFEGDLTAEYITESDVAGQAVTIRIVYSNPATIRSAFVINAYGRTFSEFTRTTYTDDFVISSDVVSAMLGYTTPTRRRAAQNMQSLLAQQAQCLYFKR